MKINWFVFIYRSYAACSRPKPWEDDQIKAYAVCPWFANTELVKETTTLEELEEKTKVRVLTVEEVGNSFEQALEADTNGGVFMVFPDVPVIQFPELNQDFSIPVIAYAKLISLCRPQWGRVNGIYGLPFALLIVFMLLYFLFWLIF